MKLLIFIFSVLTLVFILIQTIPAISQVDLNKSSISNSHKPLPPENLRIK